MLYCIQDVHGCLNTIKGLVEQILSKDSAAKLIFLGDYIDRGLWSKQTIDYVLELRSKGLIEACLLGNHDLVWCFICSGVELAPIESKNAQSLLGWWFKNGLGSCLDSYGISYDDWILDPQKLLNRIRDTVPQSHKRFLKELHSFWSNDQYFVVHAKPPHKLPAANDTISDNDLYGMVWDRPYDLFNGSKKYDKTIIVGHTPVQYIQEGANRPIIKNNTIFLDCGAQRFGIAAICLETQEITFQPTDPKDIL